jgi:hypothetical protein
MFEERVYFTWDWEKEVHVRRGREGAGGTGQGDEQIGILEEVPGGFGVSFPFLQVFSVTCLALPCLSLGGCRRDKEVISGVVFGWG